VVLYEMLTGKQPFAGETVSDTLAAVLRAEPQWDAIPAGMRRLVRRCLEKDVRTRLQAIGEARIALDRTITGEVAEVTHRFPLNRIGEAFDLVANPRDTSLKIIIEPHRCT
jgi:serine/threonine protein kinase